MCHITNAQLIEIMGFLIVLSTQPPHATGVLSKLHEWFLEIYNSYFYPNYDLFLSMNINNGLSILKLVIVTEGLHKLRPIPLDISWIWYFCWSFKWRIYYILFTLHKFGAITPFYLTILLVRRLCLLLSSYFLFYLENNSLVIIKYGY